MRSKERDSFAQIAKEAAKATTQPDGVDGFVDFLRKLYDVATPEGQREIDARKKEAFRIFSQSLKDNAKERRKARDEAHGQRYPVDRASAEIDQALDHITQAAQQIGSRVDIIKNVNTLTHSVTKELAARINALPPDLQKDPRLVFAEAARAYNSIDFRNVDERSALEIKAAIEDVFAYMRTQTQPAGVGTLENDDLWFGLGDYFLSTKIPAAAPAGQRRVFWERLRLIQTSINEGDPPSTELKNLQKNYEQLTNFEISKNKVPQKEANAVRERLAEELRDLEDRGGGGRKESAPDSADATYEYEKQAEEERSARTLGLGSRGLLDAIYSDPDPNNAGSVENLFPGNPAVQAELLRIANLFHTKGGIAAINGIPISALDSAESGLTRILRELGSSLNATQKDTIGSYLRDVQSKMYEIQEDSRGESRIQLSAQDRKLLEQAPLVFAVREIIRAAKDMMVDQTSPKGKATLDKLENILYTLFSDGFDRSRMKLFYGDAQISIADVRKIRNLVGLQTSEKQKEKFSEALVTQWHSLRWLEAKSNAPNAADKRYQDTINSLNDEDYFGLDGIYGELIGNIRKKVRAKYLYFASEAGGDPAAHDPKNWGKAVSEVSREIQKDKDLEEKFQMYLKGEYFKEKPFDEKERSIFESFGQKSEEILPWEDVTETLTKLAAVRMMMGHEKDNLDLQFLSPAYGVAQGDYPTEFNKKFFWVAAIKAPLEHHIMQWGSITGKQDLDKLIYRAKSIIIRTMAPEINEWADEVTNDLWAEIEEYRRQGTSYPQEKRAKLFSQVFAKCFLMPNKDGGPPKPTPDKHKHMADWISKLTKKKLKEEVRVFSGAIVAQRYGADPYLMMFESGFRNSHLGRDMKEAYEAVLIELSPEERKEFMKGRFLGGKIVGSARGYDKVIYTKNKERKRAEHVETMAEVAHYAPHELGRVLYERQSHSFQRWCADNVGGMAGYRDAMYDLTIHYDEIHANCDRGFLNQVDYYTGWDKMDAKQREETLASFLKRHQGDQPKAEAAARAYVDRMQSLAKHLIDLPPAPPPPPNIGVLGRIRTALGWGRHDRIPVYGAAEELGDIRYLPILVNARFDDYPYEWLQYPERMIEAAKKAGKLSEDANVEIQRVSERFFEFGDQQSGPWRREERDLGGASEAFMNQPTMMDPRDEKARMEALMKVFTTVNGYQGAESASFWTALEQAAVMLLEKTRRGYEFFEGRQGACQISEYVYPTHKARSADELKEGWEKALMATSAIATNTGQSGTVAELHRAILAATGVTNWQGLLGSHHSIRRGVLENLHLHGGVEKALERLDELLPSGVLGLKAGTLTPLVLILLLIYAASEAKKTVKGERND